MVNEVEHATLKSLGTLFTDLIQTFESVSLEWHGRGTDIPPDGIVRLCSRPPIRSVKILYAQLAYVQLAELKHHTTHKSAIASQLEYFNFNLLATLKMEENLLNYNKNNTANRNKFINEIPQNNTKLETLMDKLSNWQTQLSKEKNAAKETNLLLVVCKEILLILEQVMLVEQSQPNLLSWKHLVFKTPKVQPVTPLYQEFPELLEKIPVLLKQIQNALDLLNESDLSKLKFEVGVIEMTEHTTQASINESVIAEKFNLSTAYDLAMDLAPYLDGTLIDYDAQYIFIEILNEHLGERFITGNVWTMNFFNDAIPHAIIAIERIESTFIFAIGLEQTEDDDCEVNVQLLANDKLFSIDNFATKIEGYIQQHYLEFADAESVKAFNDLVAYPFRD